MATTTTTTRPPATLGVRVLLTLGGAALLIVGGLLKWLGSAKGTHIKFDIFYAKNPHLSSFTVSAGFIMILIGCLAILGLAARGGWVTRLAGALAVIGFILFTVNVYRNGGNLDYTDFKIGIWLCLAGGVLVLVGGFFGTRPVVVSTPAPAEPAAPAPPPPPA